MTLAQWVGYGSAAVGILIFAMRTMIPLRSTGIVHNIGQIVFGLLTGSYPMVVQHAVLLPMNCLRLLEMLRLIRKVKDAASTHDTSIEWLKPFMQRRPARAGEVLFRKGDDADTLYYVVSGGLRVVEIGIDLGPGSVVGELGMLAPGRKRTQTLTCTQDSELLRITYDKIEEIYFQNPAFGFYFLKLTSARLFDNISRLERELSARDDEIKRLRTTGVSLQAAS